MKYQLTIEVESVAELTAIVRLLADLGRVAVHAAPGPMPLADPPALVAGQPPACPLGHGPMVLRQPKPGGKTFPPFWSCALGRDQCGATVEVQA